MKIDKSEKNNDVVFWCDGQGCKTARERGGCPNPECHHTPDPTHAKHFTKMGGVWFEDCVPRYAIWKPTLRERIRKMIKGGEETR